MIPTLSSRLASGNVEAAAQDQLCINAHCNPTPAYQMKLRQLFWMKCPKYAAFLVILDISTIIIGGEYMKKYKKTRKISSYVLCFIQVPHVSSYFTKAQFVKN